ncbi:MAG: YdeI/OmpD-associated family protein [Myxococcales bacterium]|nr:YdeI/OmpD-associated family protein [Myxococcales bacterium]
MNNTSVESWLQDGCGRCDLFATPACKVHLWTDTLVALRERILEHELTEVMKWGAPCYTCNQKNVVILTALKDFCALSFVQGAALHDPDGLLVSPGPHSRYARYLKFQTTADVVRMREPTRRLLQQAIDLAHSGEKFTPEIRPEPLPEELQRALEFDPVLAERFSSLTPGRQRSHILYIGGASSTAARERRVERCVPRIMAGKGFQER